MDLKERFLNYVSYETTSYEEKEDSCSSDKMFSLADRLIKELSLLHPYEISINRFGIVDAKFYGDETKEKVAFLAHMDTSNSASGKDVKTRIVKYEGGDIPLNAEMKLSPEEFPSLNHSVGHELIVTDGTTLLGGDDKAGIAIIMTALNEIIAESKEHRPLEIIFTTDEEIGADAEHISMDLCDAKYGYTVDGGDYRAIAIESFTAYKISVHVNGKSIHPGSAKDKLINAAGVLSKLYCALPEYLRPEDTCDKEPFFHLCCVRGNEDEADAEYIVRSFDEEQMKMMISMFEFIVKRMNEKYGYECIQIKVGEQYHNMIQVLKNYPQITEEIEKVYQKLGMEYHYESIRGGTTGSQLSFMNLPCPNLGTGDYNMHGKYEYVDYDEMKAMTNVVKELMIG